MACELGPNVNYAESADCSAVRKKSPNMKTVVRVKARRRITPHKPKTPLYSVTREGHEAVVKALIEAGADVNKAADDGETPLYTAASNGHEAVVTALIEAGADVNKADNGGKTPLYSVTREGPGAMVSNGYEAVVKALIEAGAEAALDGNGMTS